MDLNKLSLNINKTYSLLINPTVHHSSSDTIAAFNIDGIQHVNGIKYFGFEIDSQLNFKSRIDNVQSKIAKGIGILFKLNKILTSNALLVLYYIHISHMVFLSGAPLINLILILYNFCKTKPCVPLPKKDCLIR